jgi:uncharacterized repeat protein (TIGR03847 family)
MTPNRYEMDNIDRLTIDAVGKPGERIFFFLARNSNRQLCVILEKIQAQTLAIGIQQFLTDLYQRNPSLIEESKEYDTTVMTITPPVEPLFRVGEIGLLYDADRDLVGIFLRAIRMDDQPLDDLDSLRVWCTREQVSRLSNWTQSVVDRGRKNCPQCGQPMEPEGHFCVKKNGHKH